MEEFYLDNTAMTKAIKAFKTNGKNLIFDKAPFQMEHTVVGTESMSKLVADSKLMVKLTEDYRSFVCDGLVPAMINIQKGFNDDADSVSNSMTSITKTSSKSSPSAYAGATAAVNAAMSDAELRVKYADYMTGNKEVDDEIIRLLSTYGEDLSGIYYSDFNWIANEADGNVNVEVTKKALSRIFQKDMEFIDGHISNKKCENCERRAETVLLYLSNGSAASEGYVFNSESMKELKAYIENYDPNSRSLTYLNSLSELERSDYNYVPGFSILDISINGVGVIFSYNDEQNNGGDEILCFVDENRTRRCIDYWESLDPNCFEYEYSLLEGDTKKEKKDNLISLYCTAGSSADVSLMDNLFKTDGSYNNVFTVDTDGLTPSGKTILAQHANDLVLYGKIDEYGNYTNAILDSDYASGYMEAMTVGTGMISTGIVNAVYSGNYTLTEGEELLSKLNVANNTELFWVSLYGVYLKDEEEGHVRNMSVDFSEDFDGKNSCEYTFNYIYEGGIHPRPKHITIKNFKLYDESGINFQCQAEIEKIKEKQEQAIKEMPVDAVVEILKVYCTPAGVILDTLANSKQLYDIKGSNAVNLFSDFSKNIEATASFIEVIENLCSQIGEGDIEIGMLNRMQAATMFETTMCYMYGDNSSKDYIVKFNDYYKIQALKRWDSYGVYYICDCDDELVETYRSCLTDEFVDNVSGALEGWFGITKYSDDEIIAATNAILYGCYSGDHPSGDYNSIYDIPVELRTEIIVQLNADAQIAGVDENSSLEKMYNDYVDELREG